MHDLVQRIEACKHAGLQDLLTLSCDMLSLRVVSVQLSSETLSRHSKLSRAAGSAADLS